MEAVDIPYVILSSMPVSMGGHGAIPDKSADNYDAFVLADKEAREKRARLYIPGGDWGLKRPWYPTCRGIEGASTHVGGSALGTNISWRPYDRETDVLAAINIFDGMTDSGYVGHLTVTGSDTIRSNEDVPDWIANKAELGYLIGGDGDPKYSAFKVGSAGIHIGPSQQVRFENVNTQHVKVGMLWGSSHITLEDCAIEGLFGIYVIDNEGGCSIVFGGVKGYFAAFLLGNGTNNDPNQFNGKGGLTNFVGFRFHIHSSAFGFLGVNDRVSGQNSQHSGLAGTLIHVSTEKTGNSVVSLSTKSVSSIEWREPGFSWAPGQVGIPNTIIPDEIAGEYPLRFGESTAFHVMAYGRGSFAPYPGRDTLAYFHEADRGRIVGLTNGTVFIKNEVSIGPPICYSDISLEDQQRIYEATGRKAPFLVPLPVEPLPLPPLPDRFPTVPGPIRTIINWIKSFFGLLA